jgi:hypothetical protein
MLTVTNTYIVELNFEDIQEVISPHWIEQKQNTDFLLTPGPHLGPRVTQHISVLHMEQRSQSQPHFFISTTWHVGQFIASPLSTIS